MCVDTKKSKTIQFSNFQIKNFKGIHNLSFNLESVPSRIVTLVGLNESGKTTVLEALSLLGEALAEYHHKGKKDIVLMESRVVFRHYSEIIPKNKQLNFSDEIYVSAEVKLNSEERSELIEFLRNKKIAEAEIPSFFQVKKFYLFKSSKIEKHGFDCEFDLRIKKTSRSKVFKKINKNEVLHKEVANFLLAKTPSVVYYPNFLFDFPDKIYLQESERSTVTSDFYLRLFQDILDSLNQGLDLENHVLSRAIEAEDGDKDAKRFLSQTLNIIGSQITSIVFDDNLSLIRGGKTRKNNNIGAPERVSGKDRRFYTRLEIREGNDNFYIKERSLGFKWFFTFMLFTQFRIRRNSGKETVFLLDEPASNLHQTAQQKLLTALKSLTSKGNTVIYTTHSHHLINPDWLGGAFIVKNQALNYDDNPIEGYDTSMTDVSIEPYRKFVGKYPNQKNYFQPILDVLEYRPSNLENIPNVVMVEGKSDFYFIRYFQKIINNTQLNLLPGMGSGGLDDAIRLYYSWGRNFIILLDSDKEGKDQKKRYIEKFNGIVTNRIFTFDDIFTSKDSKNIEIESLFSEQDFLNLAGKSKAKNKKITKNQKKILCTKIQELIFKNQPSGHSEPIEIPEFTDKTLSNFKKVLSFLETTLKNCP